MDGGEPRAEIQSRMANFPRDIMFNILSRLPLRSVIQFSCVSKSWLDMIKDPAFGKLHFYQSESEPTLLLLTHHVMGENIISISPLKYKELKLHANENAIGHIVSSHSWNLVGTCDGLLCFSSSGHEELIMVCNPVTREHVTLPKPTIAPPPESCAPMLGFGFDPMAKKYKVVRLFYPKSFTIHAGPNTHVTAEVYTLGDVGSWREVRGFDCPPHGRPVYANGGLHWLLHPGHPFLAERIVSFDLGREEFRLTPHLDFGMQVSLVELGRCLSVVDISSTTLVEISVLKDPVKNLWEMEYIIPVREPRGLDMKFPRLICVHEHNGILLIWLQDSLLSYEPRAFRLRDLRISGFPTWLDWEICSGYRGSLVPLRGFDANGDEKRDVVHFVNDMELYSLLAKGNVVGDQKAVGRCDNIVACFHKNGMLH